MKAAKLKEFMKQQDGTIYVAYSIDLGQIR